MGPERLKGKVLFPHVSYRNVSVQINYGPEALAPLPFKCRMLQEAAQADVDRKKVAVPKDKKYEVAFPVGFPNEGTFDWLDGFLEQNPHFVELSDRMIHDWCRKSGLGNSKTATNKDRPEYGYGFNGVDDQSIRRAIFAAAPFVPRNYVVMEVKKNLVEADRKENLQRFNLPHFRKVAHVVMGEPKADFKEKVHAQLLQEKQAKADVAFRKAKAEKARKKQWEVAKKKKEEADKKREKEIAERRKQVELKRKEMAEKKKAEEDAKKAKEGEMNQADEKKEEKQWEVAKK